MTRDSDQLASGLDIEKADDPIGFLAEEKGFDRHVLWRLASWGFGAVGAVTLAVLANQYSIGIRHDVLASADLTRQTQQIKSIAGDNSAEARRLSSAIATLNADRDRLYSRVTVLEQGLNTVTGSISSQIRTPDMTQANTAPSGGPEAPSETSKAAIQVSPPPSVKTSEKVALSAPESTAQVTAPVLSTPPAAKPIPPLAMAAPDPAPTPTVESTQGNATAPPDVIASIAPSTPSSPVAPDIAIQRTDFAVDLGGANSLDGLRALWRVLTKSNSLLTPLRPIVVVKENNTGLGMQLRLVAGPLGDAAAAAQICASLSKIHRSCETTVFDGQRLAMKADHPPVVMRPIRKRIGVRKPPASTLSSILGR